MIFLRKLCKEAVEKNPSLAPFLSTPGADEGVERLLEGFAFLTSRLQQKLDDSFPEITHALFQKVWPSYLRPFPAASIIEYSLTDNITGTTTIQKGTVVSSPSNVSSPCAFRTVYDTVICPLKLSFQEYRDDRGHPQLVLGFALTDGDLALLSLPYLRLFFSGKYAEACALYHVISHLTSSIDVLVSAGGREVPLGLIERNDIIRVGFDDWMLPYSAHTHEGYRILQEFFAFPEKFLFVDIQNIESALKRAVGSATSFELRFNLNSPIEQTDIIKSTKIRLFCTPVVNLFERRGIGMKAQPGKSAPICLDSDPMMPCRIYSVDRVAGWGRKEKYETEYANELGERAGIFDPERTYRLDLQPGTDGGLEELFIRVDTPSNDELSLNLDLTCTLGSIPPQLTIESKGGDEDSIPYANIAPISAFIPAPVQGDKLWRLLSGMSPATPTISSVAAFSATVSQYHFRAEYDSKSRRYWEKICMSLTSVSSKRITRLFRGMPCQGIETILVFDRSHFDTEGEIYMLGSIFSRFLGVYATISHFHRTVTKTIQGNEYPEPAHWSRSQS